MAIEEIKEFVFDENAPTPSCHASTVLPLPDGTVLAAWFGGTAEGKDDVDIWTSRRSGGKWSEPVRVSADRNVPHWNPVLFRLADGTVILFFKVGKKVRVWKTYAVKSADNGLTWGEPYEIVPGDETDGRGPVKNKPIRISNGTILAPASTEDNGWLPFVDISEDECETWQKQPDFPSKKRKGQPVPMIQPTLWESEPGRIHALVRTSVRHAYRSDSDDYGRTWCRAYPTVIKNNNSGLDVTKLPDGTLVLVSNPVAKNWGDRAPLTLMKSKDNGVTWEELFVLEKRVNHDDEYSYPAIVSVGTKLYITYTWQRKKVAYQEIQL